MPKTNKLLRIFASSPSDLVSERQALKVVVDEVNSWSTKELGISFELLTWESHTHPDFGKDPQDVINRQIGDDYDIFVGVLGPRFGTPTKNAGSGTEEEFNRAFARWSVDSSSVTIMFYFKDEALPPSKLDSTQLGLVQTFRRRIGDNGGYYRSFESTLEFERLVRVHLILLLLHFPCFKKGESSSLNSSKAADTTLIGTDDAFSERICQYVTHIIDGNCGITHALKQELLARDIITASLDTITEFAKSVTASHFATLSQESSILSATLTAHARFVDLLSHDFAQTMSMGVTELSKAVLLAAAFARTAKAQLNAALYVLNDFPNGIAMNRSVIENARSAIAKLPSNIQQISETRALLLNCLETFITELTFAELICTELVCTIRSVLKSAEEA